MKTPCSSLTLLPRRSRYIPRQEYLSGLSVNYYQSYPTGCIDRDQVNRRSRIRISQVSLPGSPWSNQRGFARVSSNSSDRRQSLPRRAFPGRAWEREDPTANHQQTTNNNQQPTTNKQQPTTNNQQTTINQKLMITGMTKEP